jgi:segregation and condensation protein B
LDHLSLHIEALIFGSNQPISLKELHQCIESAFKTTFDIEFVQTKVEALVKRYVSEEYSFGIYAIAGGYQFLTKSDYEESISILLKQKSKKKLTKAAMETLAIIAYKQPVSKGDMERLRGVSCAYSVQKLLEKELIAIKGRSSEVGRPLLYGTSDKFMEHFGLNTLRDLPKLKEFKPEENTIGELTD